MWKLRRRSLSNILTVGIVLFEIYSIAQGVITTDQIRVIPVIILVLLGLDFVINAKANNRG